MAALLVLQQFLPQRVGYASDEETTDEELHTQPPSLGDGEEDRRDPYALYWPWLLIATAFGLAIGVQMLGFVIGAVIGLVLMLLIFGETRPLIMAMIAISAPILTKAFFQFVMGIRLPESPFPVPFI